MMVFINNEPYEIAPSSTLKQALLAFGAQPPYAILVNDVFLPQSEHLQFVLTMLDRIEVIGAIQGG
ncbi:MAG: sulfur carrier protein ThiS [Pseudomonadota bacterium]